MWPEIQSAKENWELIPYAGGAGGVWANCGRGGLRFSFWFFRSLIWLMVWGQQENSWAFWFSLLGKKLVLRLLSKFCYENIGEGPIPHPTAWVGGEGEEAVTRGCVVGRCGDMGKSPPLPLFLSSSRQLSELKRQVKEENFLESLCWITRLCWWHNHFLGWK
jgi:hypothetical protein